MTTAQYRRLRSTAARMSEDQGLRRGGGPAVVLPREWQRKLARMLREGDPTLNDVLWALWDNGWSYAALAAPLGRTKAAVQQRVKWAAERSESGEPVDLGDLPSPPSGAVQRSLAHAVDLAFWPADRELYEVVALRARELEIPMWQIIEGVLEDYLDGAWES